MVEEHKKVFMVEEHKIYEETLEQLRRGVQFRVQEDGRLCDGSSWWTRAFRTTPPVFLCLACARKVGLIW